MTPASSIIKLTLFVSVLFNVTSLKSSTYTRYCVLPLVPNKVHSERSVTESPLHLNTKDSNLALHFRNLARVGAGLIAVSSTEPVFATNGQYGALESIPAGMIHPIGMFILYGISVAAAYHGIQWRSIRTLAETIKVLKAGGDNDEAAVKEFQEKRSKLISGNHRDKHISMGSILLGTGVFLSLEGALSTYWRVGELFPSEHLFAGLGLTGIWAISYALAPLMAKGNIAAKNLHFGANLVGLGLFTWQIISGWEVTVNVFNGVSGW